TGQVVVARAAVHVEREGEGGRAPGAGRRDRAAALPVEAVGAAAEPEAHGLHARERLDVGHVAFHRHGRVDVAEVDGHRGGAAHDRIDRVGGAHLDAAGAGLQVDVGAV